MHRLTALAVKSYTKPGRYADGGGLYLSISPNGGRRWVFHFHWSKRRVEMGLGSARIFTLAEAREKAAAARKLRANGVNPLVSRRAEAPPAPTFAAFADSWIEDIASGFGNEKHADQWRMTLRLYVGPIRNKLVSEITTEDVLACLQPIWTTRAETASRVRGRIERVLDAAKAKGFRTGDNPARWRGHLNQLLPKRQKLTRGHHPALPFEKMPDFLAELRAREALSAKALEFLIFSACRSNEVRGAKWDEVDLEKKIWTIPPARMKSRREHRVPLTPRMLTILAEQQKQKRGEFIFPGPGGRKQFSEGAFKVLLDRMAFGHITPHGFRSSFRDWASETTTVSREVAEMALAHVIEDKTEAAYRRRDLFEKRRKLMETWERYCLAPVRVA